MPVLSGIGRLVACKADGGQAVLHEVSDAALAWSGAEITWVGPAGELPPEHDDGEHLDGGGRLVVPGLVDAHTHLAFGGWRADEFARRLAGESYAEIAAAGGGIASTVRATR